MNAATVTTQDKGLKQATLLTRWHGVVVDSLPDDSMKTSCPLTGKVVIFILQSESKVPWA